MEKVYNQNYQNHGRIVPAYHYGVFGVFTVNLFWSVYRVIRSFSAESLLGLLMAIALLLLFFYARSFALVAQDRIIRLEMTLRLGVLLPPDLRERASEFTIEQLIALRFASDAELPELARRVLDEHVTDRKTIKKMIRNWKADFLRV